MAYAAYLTRSGHALRFIPQGAKKTRVSPAVIRQLCNAVPGLLEPKVQPIVRQTLRQAYDTWPDMIQASSLLDSQKERLLAHFRATPGIARFLKRAATTTSCAGSQLAHGLPKRDPS